MGAAPPSVSWFWRGEQACNGTVLALNVLSTLVLGCLAITKNGVSNNYAPAFAITKGNPMLSYTTGVSSSTTGITLSLTGGNIIYDSVNGNRVYFDHVIVAPSFTVAVGTTNPVNGYLTMYIPFVTKFDSGTYYCNYIDGSTPTSTSSFGTSGSFTLNVNTISGSGSQKTSASKSKALEYSLIMLGSAKILLETWIFVRSNLVDKVLIKEFKFESSSEVHLFNLPQSMRLAVYQRTHLSSALIPISTCFWCPIEFLGRSSPWFELELTNGPR